MYNLDVGEHYYHPMTNYLEAERGTRGETPGALTFDERLSKNWLHGRRYEATEARERYARSSSLARESNSKGFEPSALRMARAASEVATTATASQAQAASASASRAQLVASSMSASRQQASSQQTLDIGASAAASRARISALERELAKINKDMIRCTERALSPPYEYVKVSGRHTYAKNPNLSYSPTLSKWSSVYF